MSIIRKRYKIKLLGANLYLKFIWIKILSLLVRFIPFKVFMADTLGALLGFGYLLIHFKSWRSIAAFAHRIEDYPGWFFVLKYFMQLGRDTVWTVLFYEVAPLFSRYMSIDNMELLDKAGQGVILLGAHYGPGLCLFTLAQQNIHVMALTAGEVIENFEYTSKMRPRFLISKKYLFLSNEERTQPVGKSEKTFVRHLKNGGIVTMLIDGPRQDQGGVARDFFNYHARFNYFPFKLALKYRAPVLFYYFDKDTNGGYRLRFVPSGEFSTPTEGVEKYLAFLESRIVSCPQMWSGLRGFLKGSNLQS